MKKIKAKGEIKREYVSFLDMEKDYTDESDKLSKDWEVKQDGSLRHLGHPMYSIDVSRLTEKDWIIHMAKKGWVDMNTFIPAYFHALYMNGVKELTITTRY